MWRIWLGASRRCSLAQLAGLAWSLALLKVANCLVAADAVILLYPAVVPSWTVLPADEVLGHLRTRVISAWAAGCVGDLLCQDAVNFENLVV